MTKEHEAKCIYLDHHATTPMDERVFLKIKPFFLSQFGNPASQNHAYGWRAQDAVDDARSIIARSINAHPTEIIFTSGATESTNMALKGLLFPTSTPNTAHIVSSTIEHGATLSTVNALSLLGVRNNLVKPSQQGLVDENDVLRVMNDDTKIVSLFLVHNEIGSINPIASLARAVKARGALFHCDAAQALGRVRIDCQKLNIDLMSFSGHKVYGPKGVGFLYVRKEILDRMWPLIHGGGQEWHKRSGTLNVPGIVGLGEAVRLSELHFDEENKRIKDLRDRLLKNLKVLPGVFVNGSLDFRVSGNLNVSFAGIDGEELVLAICNRVAISTGSACSSSSIGKSRVLEEIGVSAELKQASIRFGLGRTTTKNDIDVASELIVTEVKAQRTGDAPKKKVVKILRRS